MKTISVGKKIKLKEEEKEIEEGQAITKWRKSLKELNKVRRETKKIEKEKIINVSKLKMVIQGKRNRRDS